MWSVHDLTSKPDRRRLGCEGTTSCQSPASRPSLLSRRARLRWPSAVSGLKRPWPTGIRSAIEHLAELPDALTKQCTLLLLRWSLQHRVNHLWRILPWEQLHEQLGAVEQTAVQAVFRLIDCDPPTEPSSVSRTAQQQVTLPLRYGGMGITQVSQHIPNAACVSAASVAQLTMRRGPSCFLPLSDATRIPYVELWHSIQDIGASEELRQASEAQGPLWKPEHHDLTPNTIEKILPSKQITLARADALLRRQQLHGTEGANPYF